MSHSNATAGGGKMPGEGPAAAMRGGLLAYRRRAASYRPRGGLAFAAVLHHSPASRLPPQRRSSVERLAMKSSESPDYGRVNDVAGLTGTSPQPLSANADRDLHSPEPPGGHPGGSVNSCQSKLSMNKCLAAAFFNGKVS